MILYCCRQGEEEVRGPGTLGAHCAARAGPPGAGAQSGGTQGPQQNGCVRLRSQPQWSCISLWRHPGRR